MHVSFFPRSFFAPQQHDLNVPFSLLFFRRCTPRARLKRCPNHFPCSMRNTREKWPLGNVAKRGSSFGPALDHASKKKIRPAEAN